MKFLIVTILFFSFIAYSFSFSNFFSLPIGDGIESLLKGLYWPHVVDRTNPLIKINSELVGKTFVSRVPMMSEKKTYYMLSQYLVHPEIKDTNMRFTGVCSNCGSCFDDRFYPDPPYQYIYYPIGTSFKILEFVGLPRKDVAIMLQDPYGNRIYANGYSFSELVDGGTSSCQNQQLIIFDYLSKGKINVSMKIKIATIRLEYYQRDFISREFWDFPPTLKLNAPNIKLLDYEGWLRFAVKGFTGKYPKKFNISNILLTQNGTIADAEMDAEAFVLLLHAQLIEPYSADRKDYYEYHKNKYFDSKTYQFGQKVSDIINSMKEKIPGPRKLSKKEYEDALKIVKEEEKRNHQ